MALELQQGTETKVSITTSSRSEKHWIKVFNSLAEAEIGSTSESKGAIDLKKLKEHLRLQSSKKVGFFYFGPSDKRFKVFVAKQICRFLIRTAKTENF